MNFLVQQSSVCCVKGAPKLELIYPMDNFFRGFEVQDHTKHGTWWGLRAYVLGWLRHVFAAKKPLIAQNCRFCENCPPFSCRLVFLTLNTETSLMCTRLHVELSMYNCSPPACIFTVLYTCAMTRPPRCDTRVTPEEKRRFLARRAQETEQRRALFNAETDAEETDAEET